jgi:hypothetical protein
MAWVWIDFLSDDIDAEFNLTVNYVLTIEDQIASVSTREAERVQRTLPDGDPDEAAYQWHLYQQFHEHLMPRTFRYSCLVSLVTAIDATLGAIVREVERHIGRAFKPARRARLFREQWCYLFEVGMPMRADPFVARLDDVTTVRNCIVHAAGTVKHDRDPDRVAAAVSRLVGFGISKETLIEVQKGALIPLIDEARLWLLSVWRPIFAHLEERGQAMRA